MNKKGFTLIELIATIALLGIIAIISFVSINGVINKSKVDNCKSLVNNIKSAAKNYVTDNRYSLNNMSSFMVGGNDKKYEISADVLITGNYLSSSIVNPFDNSDIDSNDVSVLIELNNDYSIKNVEIEAPAILVNCEGE